MVTRSMLNLTAAGLLTLAVAGCHSSGSRRAAAPLEPPLSSSVSGGEDRTIIEEPPPPPTLGYVDRHPLFSKPREYYENSSSNNKIARAASATFIGVPVGLYGEVKQIFVGTPKPPPTIVQ